MGSKILCEASEKGKIVSNKCLEQGYYVSAAKLSQLLILMHGTMLSKYQQPLFKQNVVATEKFPMIKEVVFQLFNELFKERLHSYICLLQKEEEVMDDIINKYGNLDITELLELKSLRVLSELCFEEGTPNIVPNDLIERVFDYYEFSDIDIVAKKEDSFQRKLKKRYSTKK